MSAPGEDIFDGTADQVNSDALEAEVQLTANLLALEAHGKVGPDFPEVFNSLTSSTSEGPIGGKDSLDMCLLQGGSSQQDDALTWTGMEDVLASMQNDSCTETLAQLFQEDTTLCSGQECSSSRNGKAFLSSDHSSPSFLSHFDSSNQTSLFSLPSLDALCWPTATGTGHGFVQRMPVITDMMSTTALHSTGREKLCSTPAGVLLNSAASSLNVCAGGNSSVTTTTAKSKRHHPPPRRLPRGSTSHNMKKKALLKKTYNHAVTAVQAISREDEESSAESCPTDTGDILLRQSANERERQRVKSINEQMECLRCFLLEPLSSQEETTSLPPAVNYPVPFPPPPTQVCRMRTYHGCCIRPSPVNNAGKVTPRKRGRRISKVDMLRAVMYHFNDLTKNLSTISSQLDELQALAVKLSAHKQALSSDSAESILKTTAMSSAEFWQPWTTQDRAQITSNQQDEPVHQNKVTSSVESFPNYTAHKLRYSQDVLHSKMGRVQSLRSHTLQSHPESNGWYAPLSYNRGRDSSYSHTPGAKSQPLVASTSYPLPWQHEQFGGFSAWRSAGPADMPLVAASGIYSGHTNSKLSISSGSSSLSGSSTDAHTSAQAVLSAHSASLLWPAAVSKSNENSFGQDEKLIKPSA